MLNISTKLHKIMYYVGDQLCFLECCRREDTYLNVHVVVRPKLTAEEIWNSNSLSIYNGSQDIHVVSFDVNQTYDYSGAIC